MMEILPKDHNLELIKNITPSMRYKDGEDFAQWQVNARARLCELLGFDNMKRAEDDKFTVEYNIQTEDYTECRFTLQSEEGYIFPVVMRVPSDIKGKMPVMLALQGHSTGMHNSFGKPIFAKDERFLAEGDSDFVVRALKEGCIGVAIEQRNFGECGGNAQTGEPECHISTMNAILLGKTTIGERVLDVMCVIDALIKYFDFIDTDNIMLMGESGGGTATLYAAAVDERISLAMPICAVCTYKHSIAAMHHCVCNFVPGIAKYFDMCDITGLIAPRKLVVVNGRYDNIFPDEGVRETYEETKRLYKAAGVPDNCALVTGEGGHRFYADAAWPVVHKLQWKR